MIFPAPHTRETIASYGYRIARLSGLVSLPELAHLFDLDLRALLMGDRHSIERLARYTGCDPRALLHGAMDASNPRRLQLGADTGNKVQCAPDRYRFCPVCIAGLAEGDMWQTCIGRTDWLIDANHVCAEHGVRLLAVTPPKRARMQPDLSRMIPALVAALSRPPIPDQPTALEGYIVERLDGRSAGRWIDGVQLDVVVHTAEVFGALATRGPQASWEGISADELREHGHIGAAVLIQGQAAIKDFLRSHVGRGRYGNDYHHAFGRAFDPFYFRKDQPAYQPICAILAEYVGENFRFTHQEKVFGINTCGLPPATLRSLCTLHGIGLKTTAQVLKAQHGIRAGASDEVDSSLIADLAPKLKDLVNAQDAARYLGVSVDLLRGLVADELLVPDYRFNDRMVGFRLGTLDAFLNQWSGRVQVRRASGRAAKTSLTTIARANRTRTSQLLLAARAKNVTFIRDRRRRGLVAFYVADKDVAGLLETARLASLMQNATSDSVGAVRDTSQDGLGDGGPVIDRV